MAYTIPRAVKEILSGHTSYSRNTSASSSSSSSFSRIPKYFRKSKGKVKGVQFLSPRKKTADESKVEGIIESDEDEERRMACGDDLEEDISVRSGKGKVRRSRFPEESNTELRAGRNNESATRLVECVNIDRKMNPSCWISVEPENSCSRTVPVDELCLRNPKWGRERNADQLPKSSTQMPLGSIGRQSHATNEGPTTTSIEGPPPAGSSIISTVGSQLSECTGTQGCSYK